MLSTHIVPDRPPNGTVGEGASAVWMGLEWQRKFFRGFVVIERFTLRAGRTLNVFLGLRVWKFRFCVCHLPRK